MVLFIVVMNKRALFLVVTALAMGAAYVFYFTDWFRGEKIRIKFRNNPELFVFDPPVELTSIKFFRSSELATNKYAHPVWSLVATNKVAPVEAFGYGFPVPGMKPAVAKTKAEPLLPNETYKLVVEAGKATGEKEFLHQAGTR
ncbi:MAG: hypothetical protein JWM68_2093 [Verrucomicrobiales bacterium]|nr:hypothetical protein [Verrucomicrobiales bacterium]